MSDIDDFEIIFHFLSVFSHCYDCVDYCDCISAVALLMICVFRSFQMKASWMLSTTCLTLTHTTRSCVTLWLRRYISTAFLSEPTHVTCSWPKSKEFSQWIDTTHWMSLLVLFRVSWLCANVRHIVLELFGWDNFVDYRMFLYWLGRSTFYSHSCFVCATLLYLCVHYVYTMMMCFMLWLLLLLAL